MFAVIVQENEWLPSAEKVYDCAPVGTVKAKELSVRLAVTVNDELRPETATVLDTVIVPSEITEVSLGVTSETDIVTAPITACASSRTVRKAIILFILIPPFQH